MQVPEKALPLFEIQFSNFYNSYELSYLSNSPYLMAESVAQLPATEHNRLRQVVSSDNLFYTGEMHYRQAAEGLWLLATQFTPQQDLVWRASYDTTRRADYYFLTFSLFEYQFPFDETGNGATLLSTTCTFYKPRTEVTTFFYKGSTGRFYNIGFTRNWIEQHLLFSSAAEKDKALEFLNNETGFLNWINIVPDAETLSTAIWQHIQGEETPGSNQPWLVDTLHQ